MSPGRHDRRHYLPVLAGVCVWLVLAALVAMLVHFAAAQARYKATGRAHAALDGVRGAVDRRLKTALGVPETLAAVITAYQRIDPDTFHAIGSRLLRDNPSIRNLALAPDNVITQIYPVRGNEAALGLRYASKPDQYPAVQQAMRTRRTVVAGPIELVQGGIGLVSRTPVFLRDAGGDDTRYWGVVSLAVDIDQLFADIDGIAARNGVAIAARRIDPGRSAPAPFVGDAAVFVLPAVVVADYPLPGGARLQLAAAPRLGWADSRAVAVLAFALLQLLAAAAGWGVYRVLASHERNRIQASRDALTGLLNRKLFDHRLTEAVLRAELRSCGLLLVDLDAFKPVNDRHGHSAGDRVLLDVGARLQALAGAGNAYRIGGDEFALLLHGVRSPGEATRLAERALAAVHEPIALDAQRSVQVTASAGVALFPLANQQERAADVFERADRALYRGKAMGGGHAAADAGDDAGA